MAYLLASSQQDALIEALDDSNNGKELLKKIKTLATNPPGERGFIAMAVAFYFGLEYGSQNQFDLTKLQMVEDMANSVVAGYESVHILDEDQVKALEELLDDSSISSPAELYEALKDPDEGPTTKIPPGHKTSMDMFIAYYEANESDNSLTYGLRDLFWDELSGYTY